MNKTEKRLEELRTLFNTGDDRAILAGISALRDEEVMRGVIKLIAMLHENTASDNIKSAVSMFLNDVKDNTLTGEVMEAIDETGSSESRIMLISSCWQSGLDYSSFLLKFTEYSINGDYMTALESYSVIEQSACAADDRLRIHCIEKIANSLDSQPPEKVKLLEETIRALSYPTDITKDIFYS